jgi:hypothetical protein
MSRQALIDAAVSRVMASEHMRKAWLRYRMVTPSMAEQIVAQFRVMAIEAERLGP